MGAGIQSAVKDTNCTNQPLPEEESDELVVMVAMEKQITTEDLHEMESKFAHFVFTAVIAIK